MRPPGLTVGGQPPAKLLRTQPAVPFIAFDSSKVKPAQQAGSKRLGRRGSKVLRSALIGDGVGAKDHAILGRRLARGAGGAGWLAW